MDENKILKVQSLLYDCTDEETQAVLAQTVDQDVLYTYAYNYNWDDGFEIPQSVLDNEKCDLSIALMIFYRADGLNYLFDKSDNGDLQWFSFIKQLYDSILNKKYQKGEIEFKVPLSRVELFKLKKILTEQENIFVENIEGRNLDIDL